MRNAPARTYEGFGRHEEGVKNLVTRIADLAALDIGEGYRSFALERADNGEPLTYGARRGAHLA